MKGIAGFNPVKFGVKGFSLPNRLFCTELWHVLNVLVYMNDREAEWPCQDSGLAVFHISEVTIFLARRKTSISQYLLLHRFHLVAILLRTEL